MKATSKWEWALLGIEMCRTPPDSQCCHLLKTLNKSRRSSRMLGLKEEVTLRKTFKVAYKYACTRTGLMRRPSVYSWLWMPHAMANNITTAMKTIQRDHLMDWFWKINWKNSVRKRLNSGWSSLITIVTKWSRSWKSATKSLRWQTWQPWSLNVRLLVACHLLWGQWEPKQPPEEPIDEPWEKILAFQKKKWWCQVVLKCRRVEPKRKHQLEDSSQASSAAHPLQKLMQHLNWWWQKHPPPQWWLNPWAPWQWKKVAPPLRTSKWNSKWHSKVRLLEIWLAKFAGNKQRSGARNRCFDCIF